MMPVAQDAETHCFDLLERVRSKIGILLLAIVSRDLVCHYERCCHDIDSLVLLFGDVGEI